ncbi:MAG: DUF2971 domain-containing protein [Gammaproteobacteria bacterium]|nr:DUF2971 domain-containing protein [Gammaproteobacteria bacterium]
MLIGDNPQVKSYFSFHDWTKTRDEILNDNPKFAYYTRAETAKQIVQKGEIWLRNASMMNDYSEISYGLAGIERVLKSQDGQKLLSRADKIYPGIASDINGMIQHIGYFRRETYITCLSIHNSCEDRTGRLSMWRAYGDVALVINEKPFVTDSDPFGIYSLPVQYYEQDDFDEEMYKLANYLNSIIDAKEPQFGGRAAIHDSILNMIYFAGIGTKHPGFTEEREWRIYFTPPGKKHPLMSRQIKTIEGIVQPVWIMKLDPIHGIPDVDIPNILERIIIGPTSYPEIMKESFIELLKKVGVNDAEDKVIMSDIPLRN